MFPHRYGQALGYLIGVNHGMRVINDGRCYTNWTSRYIEHRKAIGRIRERSLLQGQHKRVSVAGYWRDEFTKSVLRVHNNEFRTKRGNENIQGG